MRYNMMGGMIMALFALLLLSVVITILKSLNLFLTSLLKFIGVVCHLLLCDLPIKVMQLVTFTRLKLRNL
jgi:hypothetical protein